MPDTFDDFDDIQIEDTPECEIWEDRVRFEDHMRESACWTDEDIERYNERTDIPA